MCETEIEENERAVTESLLLASEEEEEEEIAEAMRELVVIESNSASLHSFFSISLRDILVTDKKNGPII